MTVRPGESLTIATPLPRVLLQGLILKELAGALKLCNPEN
jgi:hypothetical protein